MNLLPKVTSSMEPKKRLYEDNRPSSNMRIGGVHVLGGSVDVFQTWGRKLVMGFVVSQNRRHAPKTHVTTGGRICIGKLVP